MGRESSDGSSKMKAGVEKKKEKKINEREGEDV